MILHLYENIHILHRILLLDDAPHLFHLWPNEQNLIDQAIDEAARCFEIWLKDDIKKAQNRLHSFKAQ